MSMLQVVLHSWAHGWWFVVSLCRGLFAACLDLVGCGRAGFAGCCCAEAVVERMRLELSLRCGGLGCG